MKRLEKNALSNLILSDPCNIDLGKSVTSVDSTNYKDNIVWGINHSNPIGNNAEFMGQKVKILDAVDGTVSGTTFTIDYSKAEGDTLILQSCADNVKIKTLATTEGSSITTQEKRGNIKNIYIPYGITSIGSYMFAHIGADTIKFPNSVTSIGNMAFAVSKIKEIVLPESVTSLGGGCFYKADIITADLSKIKVTSLNATFQYCYKLNGVILPNGLASIGGNTFQNCTALTEITIPSNVTTINGSAFNGCANLATITVNNVEGAIAGAETAWGCPNTNVQIIYTAE